MKSHQNATSGASSSSSSSSSNTSSSSHGNGAEHHRIASVRPSKEKGHGKFIKGQKNPKAGAAKHAPLSPAATKPGGVDEIAKKLTAIFEEHREAVEAGGYNGFNIAIEKYVAEYREHLGINQLTNPLTAQKINQAFEFLEKQYTTKKNEGIKVVVKPNRDNAQRVLIKEFISDATKIIRAREPIFNDAQKAQELAMLDVITQLREITLIAIGFEEHIEMGSETLKISTISDAFGTAYKHSIPALLTKQYKALFAKEITAIGHLLNSDSTILSQMLSELKAILHAKNQTLDSIQKELNQLNKLIYNFYNLNENGNVEKKTPQDIIKLIVEQDSVGNISIFEQQVAKLQKEFVNTTIGDQPLSILQGYLMDDDNFGINEQELIQRSRELFQKLVIAQNEADQVQKQISTIEDLQQTQHNDHSHSQNHHSAVAPALKRGDAKISLENSKETEIRELEKSIKTLKTEIKKQEELKTQAEEALSKIPTKDKKYKTTKQRHEKIKIKCEKEIKNLRNKLDHQSFKLQIASDQADFTSTKEGFIETTKLIEDYLKLDKDYDILKILESFVQLASQNQNNSTLKSKIQEIMGNLSNLPKVISEGSITAHTIDDNFKSMEKLLNYYKAIGNSQAKSNALQRAVIENLIKFLKLEEQYKTEQTEYIKAFSDLAHGKILGEAGEINKNAVKFLFKFIGKVPNHDMLNMIKMIVAKNPGLDLASLRDHNGVTLLHKFVTTQSIDFEVAEFFVKNHPSLLDAKDNYGDSFMHDLADLLIELAPVSSKNKQADKYVMYKEFATFCIAQDKNLANDFFTYLFNKGAQHNISDLIEYFFAPDFMQYIPLDITNESGQNLLHLLASNANNFIKYYEDRSTEIRNFGVERFGEVFTKIFDFYFPEGWGNNTDNFQEKVKSSPFYTKDSNGNSVFHVLLEQYVPSITEFMVMLNLDLSIINNYNETILYKILETTSLGNLLGTDCLLPGTIYQMNPQQFFIKSDKTKKSILDLAVETGMGAQIISFAFIQELFGQRLNTTFVRENYDALRSVYKNVFKPESDNCKLLSVIAKIYQSHLNTDGTISTISPEELTKTIIDLIERADRPELQRKVDVVGNDKPALNGHLSLDPDDYHHGRQSTSAVGSFLRPSTVDDSRAKDGSDARDGSDAAERGSYAESQLSRNHGLSIFGDSHDQHILGNGPSWLLLPGYSRGPVGGAAGNHSNFSEMDRSGRDGSVASALEAGFASSFELANSSMSVSGRNKASSGSSSSSNSSSSSSNSSSSSDQFTKHNELRPSASPSISLSTKSTPSKNQKESLSVSVGPHGQRPGSESAEGRDMGSSDSKPGIIPRDGSECLPALQQAGSDRALVHPSSELKKTDVVLHGSLNGESISSSTTILIDDTSTDVVLVGAFSHNGE